MREEHNLTSPSQGGGLRRLAKQWLPSGVNGSLHILEKYLAQRLYLPSHFRVWLRDRHGREASRLVPGESREIYTRALLEWLSRAQDATGGGGVSGYYSFSKGWSAGYPETTGYIITTFLEAARRMKAQNFESRARRMIEWEIEVQLPDGSWQSGFVDAQKVPAVFNTGQVIDGLVAGYAWFRDARYLESAERGGRWLAIHQDEDGAWRRHTWRNNPNCYSTRVAWALIALTHATGNSSYKRTAIRYLEWAARCQDESAWFSNCSLDPGTPALTHTLGYTMEGFLESGLLLKEERWVNIAQRAADMLLHKYEVKRHLAGAYDTGWKPDHSFACLTGCAQVSRVWGRFYKLTRDTRYLSAALKLNDYVLSQIDLNSRNPAIRGGIAGSKPIWGDYMTYRIPNWAAKFALDALFEEKDSLALFKG